MGEQVIIILDQTPKSILLLSAYRERLLDIKYMSILAKAIRNSKSGNNICRTMAPKYKYDLFMIRTLWNMKICIDLYKPHEIKFDRKTIIENCEYLSTCGWLSSLDKETMIECSKKLKTCEVIRLCNQSFLGDRDFLIAILKNGKVDEGEHMRYHGYREKLFKNYDYSSDRQVIELLASKYGYIPSGINNLEKDKELAILAVKSGVKFNSNFAYLPSDWTNSRESILMAYDIDPNCIFTLPKSFKKDKELIRQIIQKGTGDPEKIAEYIDESLLKDREFALFTLEHGTSFQFFVKNLNFDREMLKIMAKRNAFNFPSKHDYRNDRDLMIEVLKYGVSFEKFDQSIQDMEIVKESLPFMKYNNSFSYIKLELRKDRELTKMALEINPDIFRYIYFEFKTDLEIGLLAIKKNPLNIQFMSTEFKKNTQIVKAAVEGNPTSLQYVDPTIENYQEIVIYCAKRAPSTFVYVKDQSIFLPQIISIAPLTFTCLQIGAKKMEYLEYALQFDKSVATQYSHYEIKHLYKKYPEMYLYRWYVYDEEIEQDDVFEFLCRKGNLKIVHSKKIMDRDLMLKIFRDYSICDLQTR